MKSLDIKRFGFATGSTLALLYAACIVLMLTVPQELTVQFFNSLLHGWDVSPLMRWDVPWWEALLGIVETFILGWLFGALFSAFYNLLPAGKES